MAVLSLELTEPGAKKLADESARIAETRGSMAIMAGDTAVFVAQVVEPLTTGHIRLTNGTRPIEELHRRLCKTITTPTLPAELKL